MVQSFVDWCLENEYLPLTAAPFDLHPSDRSHVLVGILKRALNYGTTLLDLPKDQYPFHADEEDKLNFFRKEIQSISHEKREILFQLLKFCTLIVSCSESNKMILENVAKIFAIAILMPADSLYPLGEDLKITNDLISLYARLRLSLIVNGKILNMVF